MPELENFLVCCWTVAICLLIVLVNFIRSPLEGVSGEFGVIVFFVTLAFWGMSFEVLSYFLKNPYSR